MGKRKGKMEKRVSVAAVISTERTDRKIKIDFACLNCTHRDIFMMFERNGGIQRV